MVADIRKISNGTGSARSVYQHRHFCVRTFHLLIAYPVYSCFLLFLIYLQIMDIILYFKIRSRGPFDLNIFTINQKLSEISNDIYIFNSLPIKKIMIGQTVSFFNIGFESRKLIRRDYVFIFDYR
jgi:hypothetical protein